LKAIDKRHVISEGGSGRPAQAGPERGGRLSPSLFFTTKIHFWKWRVDFEKYTVILKILKIYFNEKTLLNEYRTHGEE
jgi:hypothetical protein